MKEKILYRKANEALEEFFNTDNRALLVTGARQVGKTYAVRRAARRCFEHVVEINFLENDAARQIFSNAKGAHDILLRLSAMAHGHMVPGKTIIFFDEVQECKEMVTSIKFLVDEGSYRYVLSGSLLGIELQDIRSVPVGYLSVMTMYPLDLREFAQGIGIGAQVIEHLHGCYMRNEAIDAFVHERLLAMVRLYLIVGGMPAAVSRYVETNDLQRVLAVQRDIINLYRRDITKYAHGRKLKIEEIYDLLPSELNEKNKRFILKNLNEKARFRSYEDDFLWLRDAGIAIPTYNVEEPALPLLLSKQRNLFKLFANDVGLLTSMYGRGMQLRLLSDEPGVNFGAIYENLVAQELTAHGFSHDNGLYYFNSKKQGELDFVVEQDERVIPIEVKSGKDYHRHNALTNVLADEHYGISQALVLSNANLSVKGGINYLPIYMLMFLQHSENGSLIHPFDLTGLQ